jgi:hypothetical protein
VLLGAKDPRGDVTACATGAAAAGPDLVAARGTATELGTVGVWRLTFDRPVEVPSDLRIDVLVRDPRLPPASVGAERGVNRIVRWEATSADRPIEIIWLPHDGSTSFNPPTIAGRTVELVAPGRLLLGENVNGTESVQRARWTVLVAADGACDRLGIGVPVQRLVVETGPSPTATPTPSVDASAAPGGAPSQEEPSILRVPWVLAVAVPVVVGIWMFRRRSTGGRSSSGDTGTKLPNGHG